MAGTAGSCLFCQIARSATSTRLLYADERVVAFPDINPSAFRHYLVIPVEHVTTVNDLKRGADDHQLVGHMLNVGENLLRRDAPESKLHRFGFHQPPFNSVDHLHLHCFALPYIPSLICFLDCVDSVWHLTSLRRQCMWSSIKLFEYPQNSEFPMN